MLVSVLKSLLAEFVSGNRVVNRISCRSKTKPGNVEFNFFNVRHQYYRPFRKVEICATVLQYNKDIAASRIAAIKYSTYFNMKLSLKLKLTIIVWLLFLFSKIIINMVSLLSFTAARLVVQIVISFGILQAHRAIRDTNHASSRLIEIL